MDSTRTCKLFSLLLFLVFAGQSAPRAHAEPAVWEPDFGSPVASLSGQDDAAENVVLSFEFPFDNQQFTVVSINVNGGIALGNDPDSFLNLPWHLWHKNSFELGFAASGFPSLVAFNTDLDMTSTGQIYFNDFGDRAVFTWDGVGTNQSPGIAFATFQLQIFADGRFVYAYQAFNGDLIADLDEGIVVGYSDGRSAAPTGSVDFSNSPFSALSTNYEIWCYDEDPNADPAASNCYEPGRDNNAGFDVAQGDATLQFEPDGTGGYLVTNRVETEPPPPAPPPVLITPGGGGGHGGPAILLLMIFVAAIRQPWALKVNRT